MTPDEIEFHNRNYEALVNHISLLGNMLIDIKVKLNEIDRDMEKSEVAKLVEKYIREQKDKEGGVQQA